MSEPSVHACAVMVGEKGVLIRGPSGAGKSSLCLALIDEARRAGRFAALVADDRVLLEPAGGRLLARCIPGFEGRIERRGEGIVVVLHEPVAVIRLVIDLAPRGVTPPRWPEDGGESVEIAGISLPRLLLDLAPGLREGAYTALRGLDRVT